MGEKGNPLASMSDIPDYIASLSAAYTVYKDTQARKEDRAERETERAQLAEMTADDTDTADGTPAVGSGEASGSPDPAAVDTPPPPLPPPPPPDTSQS